MQEMRVPPAIKGSVEEILHRESRDDRIIFSGDGSYAPALSSLISSRYDALVYIDRSNALHPLHLKPDGGRTPDTYPSGTECGFIRYSFYAFINTVHEISV